MQISFTIEGEKQMSRRLLGVQQDIKNGYPIWDKVGKYVVDEVDRNFESRGEYFDDKWQDRQNEELYDWPLLEETGDMRKSFYYNADDKGVFIANELEDDYFAYHQSRQARSTNLPRRVMLKITNKMSRGIVHIVQREIQKSLQKRRLK